VKYCALVLTRDEELQIADCLASLRSAERIVLVDSGSTDRTLEIVRARLRVEVLERPFRDFADQRNFGLKHFTPGVWVLHLDADEHLTEELAAELEQLEPPAEAVAYNLAARTFLDGRPVLRAAGFPVYQTRLTRAGAFAFEQVGHGQKAPAALGALERLRSPYDHHPFEKGFAHWRARHERYAQDEARELLAPRAQPGRDRASADPIARRQWLRRKSARWPLRPELLFLYLMVVRLGVLDGPAGWEYCRRRWLYERMLNAALRRGLS